MSRNLKDDALRGLHTEQNYVEVLTTAGYKVIVHHGSQNICGGVDATIIGHGHGMRRVQVKGLDPAHPERRAFEHRGITGHVGSLRQFVDLFALPSDATETKFWHIPAIALTAYIDTTVDWDNESDYPDQPARVSKRDQQPLYLPCRRAGNDDLMVFVPTARLFELDGAFLIG